MLMIELARRQKDWPQTKLSAETRIATHFISLIENGRGIPSEDQAKRLAHALGIPVETLLQPAAELVGDMNRG